MSNATKQYIVGTSHGAIAVEERGAAGIPLLLIHGNSSCRGVFRHQLHARRADNRRIISFDLPGHGESSNAPDPAGTYTLPGLAASVMELLQRLSINEVIVLGWSLGGHIGIEMMSAFPGIRGLMIVGSPPVAPHNIAHGFTSSPQMSSAGRSTLSATEIDAFVQKIFGTPVEPFLWDAVARTDGRFRQRLFEAAREGAGVDQRLVVETSRTPLAVVNGGRDPVVKLDYFDQVAYANLWERQCHRIALAGHAPYWDSPGEFNPILDRFLQDMEETA